MPLDCVRLVKYDDFHDYIDRSFDADDDQAATMATILDGGKSSYMHDLLLEVKTPQQTFQEYKPGGRQPAAVPLPLLPPRIIAAALTPLVSLTP